MGHSLCSPSAQGRVPAGQAAPHPSASPGLAARCPPGRAQAGQPTCYFEARGTAAEALNVLNVTGSRAGEGGQTLQN